MLHVNTRLFVLNVGVGHHHCVKRFIHTWFSRLKVFSCLCLQNTTLQVRVQGFETAVAPRSLAHFVLRLRFIFLPMKASKSFFCESFWDLWVLQICRLCLREQNKRLSAVFRAKCKRWHVTGWRSTLLRRRRKHLKVKKKTKSVWKWFTEASSLVTLYW